MKRGAPAALLLILAALLAGCGGGTTTTVIEKTVTEKVPVPVTGGGESGGGKEDADARAAASKKSEEEAQEPERIVHLKAFRSPSGNIGCAMSGGGARCDIRKRDWSAPARPASCAKEVDFGQGLDVSRRGEASFVCAGDTALDPSAAALGYGTASEVGGSECISRDNGVTCVNQAGHGFFVSIQSYQVF